MTRYIWLMILFVDLSPCTIGQAPADTQNGDSDERDLKMLNHRLVDANLTCHVEPHNATGTVKGDFVALSQLFHGGCLEEMENGLTKLTVYAYHTIKIDVDLRLPSTNLVIISPTWVTQGARTIDLTGRDGTSYKGKMDAGQNLQTGEGLKGSDGGDGGHSGHFFGMGQKFQYIPYHSNHLPTKEEGSLTIRANGGSGGSGQNGGVGRNVVGKIDFDLIKVTPDGHHKPIFDAPYRITRDSWDLLRGQCFLSGGEWCDVYKIETIITVSPKPGGQGGHGGRGGGEGSIMLTDVSANQLIAMGVNSNCCPNVTMSSPSDYRQNGIQRLFMESLPGSSGDIGIGGRGGEFKSFQGLEFGLMVIDKVFNVFRFEPLELDRYCLMKAYSVRNEYSVPRFSCHMTYGSSFTIRGSSGMDGMNGNVSGPLDDTTYEGTPPPDRRPDVFPIFKKLALEKTGRLDGVDWEKTNFEVDDADLVLTKLRLTVEKEVRDKGQNMDSLSLLNHKIVEQKLTHKYEVRPSGGVATVSGDFVALSQVFHAQGLDRLPNITIQNELAQLTIYAHHTVKIDVDLRLPSTNLVIISPNWVIQGPRNLDLSGRDGVCYKGKMDAGQNPQTGEGLKGSDGGNGGHAGHFFGMGQKFQYIPHQYHYHQNYTKEGSLTIRANGGSGGSGQNGGIGRDTGAGVDFKKINYTESNGRPTFQSPYTISAESWTPASDSCHDFMGLSTCQFYTISSTEEPGMDGGQGGNGGRGGNKGSILMIDLSSQEQEKQLDDDQKSGLNLAGQNETAKTHKHPIREESNEGSMGYVGQGGVGGSGGKFQRPVYGLWITTPVRFLPILPFFPPKSFTESSLFGFCFWRKRVKSYSTIRHNALVDCRRNQRYAYVRAGVTGRPGTPSSVSTANQPPTLNHQSIINDFTRPSTASKLLIDLELDSTSTSTADPRTFEGINVNEPTNQTYTKFHHKLIQSPAILLNLFDSFGLIEKLEQIELDFVMTEGAFEEPKKFPHVKRMYDLFLTQINNFLEFYQHIKNKKGGQGQGVGDEVAAAVAGKLGTELDEDSKSILRHLYMATYSRITSINQHDLAATIVVTNINGYLAVLQQHLANFLKNNGALNTLQAIQNETTSFHSVIQLKVVEASNFIFNVVNPEIDKVETVFKSHVRQLAAQVKEKRDQQENIIEAQLEYQKEIERQKSMDLFFGILKLGAQGLSVLGPLGKVTGDVVGGALNIVQSAAMGGGGHGRRPHQNIQLPASLQSAQSHWIAKLSSETREGLVSFSKQVAEVREMLTIPVQVEVVPPPVLSQPPKMSTACSSPDDDVPLPTTDSAAQTSYFPTATTTTAEMTLTTTTISDTTITPQPMSESPAAVAAADDFEIPTQNSTTRTSSKKAVPDDEDQDEEDNDMLLASLLEIDVKVQFVQSRLENILTSNFALPPPLSASAEPTNNLKTVRSSNGNGTVGGRKRRKRGSSCPCCMENPSTSTEMGLSLSSKDEVRQGQSTIRDAVTEETQGWTAEMEARFKSQQRTQIYYNRMMKLKGVTDLVSSAMSIHQDQLALQRHSDDISGQIEEGRAQLKRLEGFQVTIENKLRPFLLDSIARQFDSNSEFQGGLQSSSSVGLLVSSMKVQSFLRDVKLIIRKEFTEGFAVQEFLGRAVERLEEGLLTLINIYDQLQDYEEQSRMASFIANLHSASLLQSGGSSSGSVFNIENSELRNILRKLQLIVQSNVILGGYEKVLTSLKMWLFPFAHRYLSKFSLPPSLRRELSLAGPLAGESEDVNGTRNLDNFGQLKRLVTHVQTKIDSIIQDKGKEDTSLSIFESHLIKSTFYKTNSTRPFSIWRQETGTADERENGVLIRELLSGGKVLLTADIRQSPPRADAIKFNRIGIQFWSQNKSLEIQLRDKLAARFAFRLTHMGNSYYRFNGSGVYVMSTSPLTFFKSFRGDTFNRVVQKVGEAEPMLSPYTMWEMEIVPVLGGHQDDDDDGVTYRPAAVSSGVGATGVGGGGRGGEDEGWVRRVRGELAQFAEHVDLHLVGEGTYVMDSARRLGMGQIDLHLDDYYTRA